MKTNKQQIIVIHGGNAFEKYEEYLDYLRNKETTIEKMRFKDWKANLGTVLGDEYDVLNPQMPNASNARYAEWKIWFEKLILLFDEDIIFIGHSLGGVFLAKYLSENDYPKKIKATFLVAAPFNTDEEHPLVDFVISNNLERFAKQGGKIFIYQSRDDEVVPFSNSDSYKKALPEAILKVFEDRQHFNQKEFPEIVETIKSI